MYQMFDRVCLFHFLFEFYFVKVSLFDDSKLTSHLNNRHKIERMTMLVILDILNLLLSECSGPLPHSNSEFTGVGHAQQTSRLIGTIAISGTFLMQTRGIRIGFGSKESNQWRTRPGNPFYCLSSDKRPKSFMISGPILNVCFHTLLDTRRRKITKEITWTHVNNLEQWIQTIGCKKSPDPPGLFHWILNHFLKWCL
jgi:hypothetical protein